MIVVAIMAEICGLMQDRSHENPLDNGRHAGGDIHGF